jgi:hypothetical protein
LSGDAQTHLGAAHYRLLLFRPLICKQYLIDKPEMCLTRPKVYYYGQHQNAFRHHSSFTRKKWIRPAIRTTKGWGVGYSQNKHLPKLEPYQRGAYFQKPERKFQAVKSR